MSTSSSRCRSGKTLGVLVGKVLKGLKKKRLTEEDIRDIWRSAAGEKASSHSRPVSMRKSVLRVNVDDSAWLYELTLAKKDILGKLREASKAKKIKEIRFRIGEIKNGKKD